MGSVATNMFVSAWGEVTADGTAYDPYRCMGSEFGNYFDQETGLVLCGQRYYDPSGGRWINRDPISYAGGLNVYGYVGNNPTNFVDPSGLMSWRDWWRGNIDRTGLVYNTDEDPNQVPCVGYEPGDQEMAMIDEHQKAGAEAADRGFKMVGTGANFMAATRLICGIAGVISRR